MIGRFQFVADPEPIWFFENLDGDWYQSVIMPEGTDPEDVPLDALVDVEFEADSNRVISWTV